MRQENISTIKQQILRIRFGILKAPKNFILKSPISFMVEAVEITDDGCLVCHKSDPSLRPLTTGSRVIIKFIQKQEGLFIKLTGSTVSSESDMVKIRIEETQCFQKKSTSPYTSFLQTLGVFTGNFKKVGQAV